MARDLGEVVEDIVDRVAALAPGTEAERRARHFSVRFWAHNQSNTLLTLVPPEQVELAEKLIKLLDTPRSEEEGAGEIKFFPLKFGEAEAISAMLEKMVEQVVSIKPIPGGKRRGLEETVNIWPDQRSNSLLSWCHPPNCPWWNSCWLFGQKA